MFTYYNIALRFWLRNLKNTSFSNAHPFYILLHYQNHSNIKNNMKNTILMSISNHLLSFSATSKFDFKATVLKSRPSQNAKCVEIKSCTRLHEQNDWENAQVQSFFRLRFSNQHLRRVSKTA